MQLTEATNTSAMEINRESECRIQTMLKELRALSRYRPCKVTPSSCITNKWPT